jgi:hypothetical protein
MGFTPIQRNGHYAFFLYSGDDMKKLILAAFFALGFAGSAAADDGSVTVISPNGGEMLAAGTKQTITWKATLPASVPAQDIVGEIWLVPVGESPDGEFRPILLVKRLNASELKRGSYSYVADNLPEASPRCKSCEKQTYRPYGSYTVRVQITTRDCNEGETCTATPFAAYDDSDKTFEQETALTAEAPYSR